MIVFEWLHRAYCSLSEPMVEVVHCSWAKELEVEHWDIVPQGHRQGTWVDDKGEFVTHEGRNCSSLRNVEFGQFLVVEERERYFSIIERVMRSSLGFFCFVMNLGQSFNLKEQKSLLFAEKEVVLLVVTLDEALDSSSKLVATGDGLHEIASIDFTINPRLVPIARLHANITNWISVKPEMMHANIQDVKVVELRKPQAKKNPLNKTT